jgi:hypothetical protein
LSAKIYKILIRVGMDIQNIWSIVQFVSIWRKNSFMTRRNLFVCVCVRVLYKVNGLSFWCWQQMVRMVMPPGWYSSIISALLNKRHYATSRKGAGSIPDEVLNFF